MAWKSPVVLDRRPFLGPRSPAPRTLLLRLFDGVRHIGGDLGHCLVGAHFTYDGLRHALPSAT